MKRNTRASIEPPRRVLVQQAIGEVEMVLSVNITSIKRLVIEVKDSTVNIVEEIRTGKKR